MYNVYATNKLQDGGTHFATLLTITSSSSSNAPCAPSGGVGGFLRRDRLGSAPRSLRGRLSLSAPQKPCGCTPPSVSPYSDTRGPALSSLTHPGGNQGANLKSISHRCHPILVAVVWELTKKNILFAPGLPPGSLSSLTGSSPLAGAGTGSAPWEDREDPAGHLQHRENLLGTRRVIAQLQPPWRQPRGNS